MDDLLEKLLKYHANIIEIDSFRMDEILELLKKDIVNKYGLTSLNVIYPDGDNIKKGQIKDLKKMLSYDVVENKDFHIIVNAHLMNSAAYNSILKFLEEPPNNIIIVMLTDNIMGMADTVKSRCNIIKIKDYSKSYSIEIADTFNEILKIENYPNYHRKMLDFYKNQGVQGLEMGLLSNLDDRECKNKFELISLINDLKYNINTALLVDEIYYQLVIRRKENE